MEIKNILISQPQPALIEKSPYYEITQKYGTDITYKPFIRVEGISVKEFRSQRIEILDHSAVIFTSRTTVDHFFRICEESRVTVPKTMKYLCNTEAVALYLQKYIVYRKRKIFFANGTFPNFMELIIKHKGEKMLLILSEPYNPELASTMEKLKLNFNKVILSRTVSSDLAEVDINRYDLLALFSPAEVSSLTSQFVQENIPIIAAFGENTAKAALQAGLRLNVLAPTPQAPSMAKAIDIFINKIRKGEEIQPVVLSESKKADEFIKSQESKPGHKNKSKKQDPQKSVSGKKTA